MLKVTVTIKTHQGKAVYNTKSNEITLEDDGSTINFDYGTFFHSELGYVYWSKTKALKCDDSNHKEITNGKMTKETLSDGRKVITFISDVNGSDPYVFASKRKINLCGSEVYVTDQKGVYLLETWSDISDADDQLMEKFNNSVIPYLKQKRRFECENRELIVPEIYKDVVDPG